MASEEEKRKPNPDVGDIGNVDAWNASMIVPIKGVEETLEHPAPTKKDNNAVKAQVGRKNWVIPAGNSLNAESAAAEQVNQGTLIELYKIRELNHMSRQTFNGPDTPVGYKILIPEFPQLERAVQYVRTDAGKRMQLIHDQVMEKTLAYEKSILDLMKVYHDTLALITEETIDAMMEKVPEDKRVAMNAEAHQMAMAQMGEKVSNKNNKLIKRALEEVEQQGGGNGNGREQDSHRGKGRGRGNDRGYGSVDDAYY